MNWVTLILGVLLYIEGSSRIIDWTLRKDSTWKQFVWNTFIGVLGMLLILWS